MVDTALSERRGNTIRAENKDSKVLKLGQHALYLAASFVYLSMYFLPDLVPEAFGVFGGIAMVVLGGGTWTNLKERDVAKARVGAANGGAT